MRHGCHSEHSLQACVVQKKEEQATWHPPTVGGTAAAAIAGRMDVGLWGEGGMSVRATLKAYHRYLQQIYEQEGGQRGGGRA